MVHHCSKSKTSYSYHNKSLMVHHCSKSKTSYSSHNKSLMVHNSSSSLNKKNKIFQQWILSESLELNYWPFQQVTRRVGNFSGIRYRIAKFFKVNPYRTVLGTLAMTDTNLYYDMRKMPVIYCCYIGHDENHTEKITPRKSHCSSLIWHDRNHNHYVAMAFWHDRGHNHYTVISSMTRQRSQSLHWHLIIDTTEVTIIALSSHHWHDRGHNHNTVISSMTWQRSQSLRCNLITDTAEITIITLTSDRWHDKGHTAHQSELISNSPT